STTSKTFTVDGNTVSLNAAYATQGAMVTAVQGQLNSAAAGKYTVAASGANGFTITTTATGASSAMTIGGADSAFVNTNVAGTDAVAGTPANLALATGDLTIDGTDMAGSYKDAQSLVDAINAKGISGVAAYYDSSSKSVHLNAQSALTVDGTKAGAGAGNLGFSGAGATAIAVSGDLASSNVKTVSGANDTISRIDAALGTISSMRSDLGAVQNRFTSTIANLQTISQNLNSSRSQIQDADFAAETANMSSANILQQAGVSVLAQANATTQSVLKLLQ
ncbi:MAG TPA: flagellin, partial [Rhodanobacter sp.]|nr:flagellin [Rhodanobacter sp.]